MYSTVVLLASDYSGLRCLLFPRAWRDGQTHKFCARLASGGSFFHLMWTKERHEMFLMGECHHHTSPNHHIMPPPDLPGDG
jgi:hypothetical protein